MKYLSFSIRAAVLVFAGAVIAVAGGGQRKQPIRKAAFPKPVVPFGEVLVYHVTEISRGRSFIPATKVVRSRHVLTSLEAEGGEKVIRHICREVRRDGVTQNWNFDYLDTGDGVRAAGYKLDRFTPRGDNYYHEEAVFDDDSLSLPPDIIHVLSLPMFLTGIKFTPGENVTAHTWAQEGVPARVLMKVCGSERVEVPWKVTDAWKVCIKVDTDSLPKPIIGIGKIVSQLLPRFSIWFEKRYPHRPLKIHGVFGPLAPGKPEYIEELVKVHANTH